MDNIYKNLAEHLNRTPGGFPPTPSGVEIKILKNLFSEKEAQIALTMSMSPEPASAIAQRTGEDIQLIEPHLLEMSRKGLILRITKTKLNVFMLQSFVIGIWEHQVNRLTPELIKLFNEYVPYLTKEQFKNKTQQLRVVPVDKSITTDLNIMDYEQLEKIIKSQSKIRVAPCICRKEQTMSGTGCGRIEEACLVFGGSAYIYENRGIGRDISSQEALELINKAVKQGLVAQPSNSRKPVNVCLCCSCCCQILKNIKKLESPSSIVSSNFHVFITTEDCTGCGSCEDICPMDAINMDMEDMFAKTDLKRCIGCGLCVSTCDFDAIRLVDKPKDKKVKPPANIVETYVRIAKEKGLF